MPRENLRLDSPIYTLALHLFRQYLVNSGKTTEDAEQTSMRDFYIYLSAQDTLFTDRDELVALYSITEEELELFEERVRDPFQFLADMYPIWPMVAFAFKHSPKIMPVSIALTALIKWDDGTATALPNVVEVPAGVPVDGFVLTAWRRMVYDSYQFYLHFGGAEGLHKLGSRLSAADVDERATCGVDAIMQEDDEDFGDEDSELDVL